MNELRDELEAIITKKLDDMPNYEPYMVNSTMKVLAVDAIMQLIQQERVKAQEEASKEDDKQMMLLLEERDNAIEWADKLAYAIGSEEDIGEHSNINNPWKNALELIDNLKQSLGEKK